MMTATACPSADRIRALSLGQLGEAQSDELFEHIRSCDACRSELETIEDSQDSLVASLRAPDDEEAFEAEPDCQLAVAKALGALAEVHESATMTQPSDLPRTIGEYEIERPIGHGGMGNVYLARHTKLGRDVALKVVAHHRLGDQRTRERFEAEMRAVGRLSHPNIVTAHDARDVDGTAVLVTEYIDGLDVGELSRRMGPLPVADACEIVRMVAVALQYTHGQGFVHRDVKPSNVMVSSDGEVKLLDLGLARLQWGDEDNPQGDITGTGQAMGTADYIAPEQVKDCRNVDSRADIYSLGCTLFRLITGTAPFDDAQHPTAFSKMTAHVSHEPPTLKSRLADTESRRISGDLESLVMQMLHKSPEDRPQSPQEIAKRLERYCRDANLMELVTRAEATQASPAARVPAKAQPTLSTTSTKRNWIPGWVGWLVAVATLFAGFYFGVIITIKYPDGTIVKLIAPEGSELNIEQSDQAGVDEVPSDSAAQTNGAITNGSMPNAAQPDIQVTVDPTPAYDVAKGDAPLLFIVAATDNMSLRAKPELEAWLLERKEGDEQALVTDEGIWFPVDGTANWDDAVEVNGQRYGLVSIRPENQIGWNDIKGNMSAMSTTGGGRGGISSIRLRFEGSLATRMEQVTGANIRRRLAVVFNGRIISAPYIQSALKDECEIRGRLSYDEVRYLHQTLTGGLVDPLPKRGATSSEKKGPIFSKVPYLNKGSDNGVNATAEGADKRGSSEKTQAVSGTPFYGAWSLVQGYDSGKEIPLTGRDQMAFSFGATDVHLYQNKALLKGGEYAINQNKSLILITFEGEKATRGIFRFLSQNELEISLDESGENPPSDFENLRGHDLYFRMRRVELTGDAVKNNYWRKQASNQAAALALDELQRKRSPDFDKKEIPRFEVIGLGELDPQVVFATVNRFFDLEGGRSTRIGLIVDVDLSARRLLVKGTDAQIAQIRDLLEKLQGDERQGAHTLKTSGLWRVSVMETEGTKGERQPGEGPQLYFGLDVTNSRFFMLEIDKLVQFGSLTFDPEKLHVDMIEKSVNGTHTKGLYRLLDNGDLQLCLPTQQNGPRPFSISSSKGSGTVVLTLQHLLDFPVDREDILGLDEDSLRVAALVEKAWDKDDEQLYEAVSDIRDAAHQAITRNNLRRIGIAFHNFQDAYQKFPGTANTREGSVGSAPGKKIYPFSWRVAILPFIDQNELFEEYRFDEPWDSEQNLKLLDKMPEIYRSPLATNDQEAGYTNYLGVASAESAIGDAGGQRLRDIIDGTSYTMLLMETECTVPWTAPEDIPADSIDSVENAQLFEGRPLNVLMADGSVRSFDEVDWDLVKKLVTRAGGERFSF